MAQKFALATKILTCILAGFIVLMSFDVIKIEASPRERIGGFFISISPGLIILVVVVLFWKKEWLLAFMC